MVAGAWRRQAGDYRSNKFIVLTPETFMGTEKNLPKIILKLDDESMHHHLTKDFLLIKKKGIHILSFFLLF